MLQHLVAARQLEALRRVLAQRLLRLALTRPLFSHLLEERLHVPLGVLRLTRQRNAHHQQVLCTAHGHLVRLQSATHSLYHFSLLAVRLHAVEQHLLHAAHVLSLQLRLTRTARAHLLEGLRNVLLQEQHHRRLRK